MLARIPFAKEAVSFVVINIVLAIPINFPVELTDN